MKWAFIFKLWFFIKMCLHFQNVKGFVSAVFSFLEKDNCKQKICTFTANSFTDEDVNTQWNIYNAYKFFAVVKNLWFIIYKFERCIGLNLALKDIYHGCSSVVSFQFCSFYWIFAIHDILLTLQTLLVVCAKNSGPSSSAN